MMQACARRQRRPLLQWPLFHRKQGSISWYGRVGSRPALAIAGGGRGADVDGERMVSEDAAVPRTLSVNAAGLW